MHLIVRCLVSICASVLLYHQHPSTLFGQHFKLYLNFFVVVAVLQLAPVKQFVQVT